jgi:hypothetical protein
MEVYDTELHAGYEALHPLNALDIPIAQEFIYIDNFSAIQILADNKDNSEPAKMATQLAYSPQTKRLQTVWTSHIAIKGNEKADEMAKLGAKGELDLYQDACATRAWWYIEAWKRFWGSGG